jgi:integrase
MTQLNYISPSDFQLFLVALEKIKAFSGRPQKPPVGKTTLKILAQLEYGCGLRVTEALNLKKENFDLEHNILTLHNTKTGWKKCSKCKGTGIDCTKCEGIGKLRKVQYTTIPPWLVKPVQWYLNGKDEPLFPITRYTVWKYFKEAGQIAGLKIFEQQDERYLSSRTKDRLKACGHIC